MFRFVGIPATIADKVRTTMRSPQYGHPAHRELAKAYGPCRLCLRTFDIGKEDRVLFTYQPFSQPGSLPAPGPVFVHAHECERYDAGELPPDFRQLPLVIEGYSGASEMVAQVRVGDQDPDAVIARVFREAGADYAHIRNGEAGCFMARINKE